MIGKTAVALALTVFVAGIPQVASAQGYYGSGGDNGGGGGGKGGGQTGGGATQPGDDKGGQNGNGATQPGDGKGGQNGNGGTQPGDDKGGQNGNVGTQPGDDKGGQNGNGGTQPGDDRGGQNGGGTIETPGAEAHVSGNIERLPAGGVLGDWTVAGTTIHVVPSTSVEQHNGPAVTGACVEVQGTVNSDQTVSASEVKVESGAGGCSTAAVHDAQHELEFSGFVQAMPQTGMLFGTWMIGGRSVQVTTTTDIRLGKAQTAAGACAEVKGTTAADGSVSAARLSLKDDERACGGGAQPEFVGIVQSLPSSGATGDWMVGMHVLHVSATTVVDNSAAIATGGCVEARGVLQPDNSLDATHIERVDDARCGAATPSTPATVELEGLVETVPANVAAGDWTIAGKTVHMTASTTIDNSRGAIAVGACAEVAGMLQPDGSITASKVEVESTSGTCLFRSGVTNAASFSTQAVSPGQLVSIFGMNLGTAGGHSMEIGSDDSIATRLGNVRVYFNGVAAPLLIASRTQVNALVPYEVRGKEKAEVQVENNGAWSNPITMTVAATAPAIFTSSQNGHGQAQALNYEAEHGAYVPNDDAHPAGRGSTVVLYTTGLGEIEDARHDGRIARTAAPTTLPVKVTIGGHEAQVDYAGTAPGLVSGVIQVNVRIPDDAPAGAKTEVIISTGDRRSQDDVTIAIR